jgi:hypothetical protein
VQAAATPAGVQELGDDRWRAVVANLTLELSAARAAAAGAGSATAPSAVSAATPGPSPVPGTPSKYGEGYFRTNPDGTEHLVFLSANRSEQVFVHARQHRGPYKGAPELGRHSKRLRAKDVALPR